MLRKYATLEVLDAWRVPAGTSKRALVKAAHRVAFDYAPRNGYLYVRSRMISSRCNDNHDEFPAGEIEAGYKSFLGKPVFVNHHNANHRRARGVIVAVALHRDRNPDGTPDTWVEGLMEIDALRFPRLAKALIKKRINRTSMGVDVERSTCSACGNQATSPAEYCRHLPSLKGKKIRLRREGKIREEIIREICAGLSFFENSLLVEEPADPTAVFLGDIDTRGMSKDMLPRSASLDMPDQRRRDAEHAGDLGQRQASLSDQLLDPRYVSFGEPGLRVPAAGQAAPSGDHVGRVLRIGAQRPVRRVHAQQEVAGMQDDLFRRNRSPEQLPAVAMGSHRTAPGIGQAESRVSAVEGPARPRVTQSRAGGKVDMREVPLDLRGGPDKLTGRSRPADHGVYFSAQPALLAHFQAANQEGGENPVIPSSRLPRVNIPRGQTYEGPDHQRWLDDLISGVGRDDNVPRHHTREFPVRRGYDDERRQRLDVNTDAWRDRETLRGMNVDPLGGPPDAAKGLMEAFDRGGDPSATEREHGWRVNRPDQNHSSFTPLQPGSTPESVVKHLRARWNMIDSPLREKPLPADRRLSRQRDERRRWNRAVGPTACEHDSCPPWEHRGGLRAEAAPRKESVPGQHPFFEHSPVHPQHIVNAYNESDEDARAIGRHWYPEAHHIAKAMAHNYGHSLATTAGVLSAYSPRTLWPVNMMNASRALRDPDNAPGPGSGAMGNHQKSAQRILRGEHYNDVLTRPKTNSFAHLIEHGGDSEEDKAAGKSRVVIDRHALSVAIGRRVSDDDLAKAPISEPRDTAQYNYVADTYRQAADQLSKQHGHVIHPHEVQAVTWLVQQQRNHKQDEELNGATGKGRIALELNSWKRWHQHAHDQHPEVQHDHFHLVQPGKTTEEMHEPTQVARPPKKKAAGMRYLAYGETTVPPKINTLRQEECPVCGEANVWTGDRCPVCGFVSPPDLFRDPDVDKAAQVRDELEQAGEVGMNGLPQGPADEAGQQGSFPDADHQLFHPDQLTPNGVPAPVGGQPSGDMQNGPDPENPEEAEEQAGQEEIAEGEQAEQAGEEEAEQGEEDLESAVLGCPACGSVFAAGDQGAQPGARCPACGQAPLEPVDDPGNPEKDQEPSPDEGDEDVMSTKTAAQREQLAGLRKENAVLRAQLRFMAELAGVSDELDQIRSQADLMNPASPVPDPPQQPATQSTEDALASGGTEHSGPWPRGTGHTEDDPSRPGTTPGSTANVPAAQTSTPLTPGIEMPAAPATNLTDVTAPVTGTNPSQDGGVPIQQRRIETDVRIAPDPLKASGPGIGGQGNDGTAFPWMLAAREKEASMASGDAAIRTMASMRLGRLRVQAGLVQGDDLDIGAGIERDASLSVHDIEREIEVLGQMARRRPAPGQQRQMARTSRAAPSMASAPAPLTYATAASMDEADAFDIFLD